VPLAAWPPVLRAVEDTGGQAASGTRSEGPPHRALQRTHPAAAHSGRATVSLGGPGR
jgi:hypothetical protein